MNQVKCLLSFCFITVLPIVMLSQNIQQLTLTIENPDSLEQRALERGQFTQFATVTELDLSAQMEESHFSLMVNLVGAYGTALEYTIHDFEALEVFEVVADGIHYNLIDWAQKMGKSHTISDLLLHKELFIHATTKDGTPVREVLSIHRSFPIFRDITELDNFEAADCDIDVVCAQTADYTEISKGVVRIYVVHVEGIGFCSGALMNNTQEDFTPYILSGFHCMDGFTPRYDMWRFEFNFLKKKCNEDTINEENFYIQSCSEVAGWRDSDFLLLEMGENVPPFYNINYYGWNATESLPDSAYMLHHPSGDPMKVSVDQDPITIIESKITWNTGVVTPPFHHIKLEYDLGSQEGGSSGAPAFNTQDQIIGQLNGGKSNCTDPVGYYGRISKSWEGGGSPESRLKDWLDPLNMNTLDFPTYKLIPQFRRTIFHVQDGADQNVPHVDININTTPQIQLRTDADGIAITDKLLKNEQYTYSVGKMSTDFYNGLSGKDVTSVTRLALGIDPINFPYQLKIADINNDGVVNTTDRLLLIEVVLKLQPLTGRLWHFFPENPVILPTSESQVTEKIKAYKLGDLNFSADPTK